MDSLKNNTFHECSLSTITLDGLRTIYNIFGSNPENMITTAEKLGIHTFQYVPLRGHTIKNLKQSGIIDKIVTMEGIFEEGLASKILFGNTKTALKNNLYIANENPSIISIDLLDNSAIEIADCSVKLLNKGGIIIQSRTIEEGKRMVLDNFHARDYTSIGRDKNMKGIMPKKGEMDKVIENIMNKKPNIVCIHIQERNPEEIKKFLSNNDTLLEFEINTIKQHIGENHKTIPIIIELDPVPLAPLSGGIKTLSLHELINNSETLKRFIDKTNTIRYG